MRPPDDHGALLAADWPLWQAWCAWLLVVLLWLAPTLAAGHVPIFGDALNQDLPLRELAARGWRAGEVPFWNPYNFAGHPLLAVMHVGVFFPLNAAFLILPAAVAQVFATAGGLWLAGAGMIALAWSHGTGRVAALVAAAVFTGSGFVLAHLENLQILHGAAMLPWLLAVVHRLAATGAFRFVAAGATVVLLQVLAGHPHMVVFPWLLVAAYAAALAWVGTARGATRFGCDVVAMMALGGGLAAFQLLPMLAFVADTQRGEWAETMQTTLAALQPRQILTLWVPGLLGGRPSAWMPCPYFGAVSATEGQLYVGLVTLVLGAAALVSRPRAPLAPFWAAGLVVSLLLVLGDHTPLAQILLAFPPYRMIAYSPRHALELAACASVLAALGIEALGRLPRVRRAVVAALVGLPTLVVWGGIVVFGEAKARQLAPFVPAGEGLVAFWRPDQPALWLPLALAFGLFAGLVVLSRPRALVTWACLVLVVDLGLYGELVAWRTRTLPRDALPVVRPLSSLGTDRVLALYPDFIYPYDMPEVQARLRLPNWAALADVRHVGGYDAFIDRRYSAMLGGMYQFGGLRDRRPFGPSHRALDLLSCRYVLLDARLAGEPAWREALSPPRWVRRREEPGVFIIENTAALPRAWRVDRVTVVSPEGVQARIEGRLDFAPREEALSTEPLDGVTQLSPGPARLVREAFNTLALETDGAGPGLVVVSVRHAPGWRVVEPSGATLVTVDGVLMGVRVPAGAHRVTLGYEPPGWRTGLAVSASTLLGLGAVGWLRRRRRELPAS